MHKTSLLAPILALTLAGTPVVASATASAPHHGPIAHIALGLSHRHHGLSHRHHQDGYVDPFGPGDGQEAGHYVDPFGHGTPGHGDGNPGTAYGQECSTESHRHVEGEHSTPFADCVHALTVLAKGTSKSPAQACRLESKRHIKGHARTPFSSCVAAAKKFVHKKR